MSIVIKFYYTKPIIVTKNVTLTSNDHVQNYEMIKTLGVRQTYAFVWDVDANVVSVGIATCSHNDKFVKKTGRELAQDRALKRPHFQSEFTGEFKDFILYVLNTGKELEDGMLTICYKNFKQLQ